MLAHVDGIPVPIMTDIAIVDGEIRPLTMNGWRWHPIYNGNVGTGVIAKLAISGMRAQGLVVEVITTHQFALQSTAAV